jgi:hypothetical protein
LLSLYKGILERLLHRIDIAANEKAQLPLAAARLRNIDSALHKSKWVIATADG